MTADVVTRGDFHTLDDATKEMRAKGRLPG